MINSLSYWNYLSLQELENVVFLNQYVLTNIDKVIKESD